jgi:hypothetical protein
MLYRLLRQEENWELGLMANNPNSYTSVFDHVTKGSSSECRSPYISTCGSLNSVIKLKSKSKTHEAQIVRISEDNLPVVKIDLRTLSNRKHHYVPDTDSNESINRYNCFARVYEEVLLVGYVPKTHVELMNESDLNFEQLPAFCFEDESLFYC